MSRASGSYGWLAGSLQGKLFGLLLLLIAMQCYNSIRNPFVSLFQIVIILRCVLRRVKFGCHFFSYRSLLLSTSVLNDNAAKIIGDDCCRKYEIRAMYLVILSARAEPYFLQSLLCLAVHHLQHLAHVVHFYGLPLLVPPQAPADHSIDAIAVAKTIHSVVTFSCYDFHLPPESHIYTHPTCTNSYFILLGCCCMRQATI